MNIPGAAAQHAIITPECIAGRGEEGAVDEALARLRVSALDAIKGWRDSERQPRFHLVLTVERPDPKETP